MGKLYLIFGSWIWFDFDIFELIYLIFKDLHSGVFGGTVSEGMADLMWMMNQLVDGEGNILVEGLMDRFKI